LGADGEKAAAQRPGHGRFLEETVLTGQRKSVERRSDGGARETGKGQIREPRERSRSVADKGTASFVDGTSSGEKTSVLSSHVGCRGGQRGKGKGGELRLKNALLSDPN